MLRGRLLLLGLLLLWLNVGHEYGYCWGCQELRWVWWEYLEDWG